MPSTVVMSSNVVRDICTSQIKDIEAERLSRGRKDYIAYHKLKSVRFVDFFLKLFKKYVPPEIPEPSDEAVRAFWKMRHSGSNALWLWTRNSEYAYGTLDKCKKLLVACANAETIIVDVSTLEEITRGLPSYRGGY